jgi:hypothetical protein
MNRYRIDYNPAENDPTIVMGLGGYANKKSLSSARQTEYIHKFDKLTRVISTTLKQEVNPLIKVPKKDPHVAKIMEDVKSVTTAKLPSPNKQQNRYLSTLNHKDSSRNRSRSSTRPKTFEGLHLESAYGRSQFTTLPTTRCEDQSDDESRNKNSRLIRSVSDARLAVYKIQGPPTPKQTQEIETQTRKFGMRSALKG